MAHEIRIHPDATFVQWVKSFTKLASGMPMSREAVEEWEQATEVMFDLTQQYAHVLSGDMLRSGTMGIEEVSRTSITAHITYGGGQRSNTRPHWEHQKIDYVKYELRRGGSHDFFKLAHQSAERRLQAGAKAAMMAHINSLRWK